MLALDFKPAQPEDTNVDDMDGFGVVASVTQLERPTRTTGSLVIHALYACV